MLKSNLDLHILVMRLVISLLKRNDCFSVNKKNFGSEIPKVV